jgi:thioredoxin-dependent peroxiredoxin
MPDNTSDTERGTGVSPLGVGDPAPDFSLPADDGRTVSLAAYSRGGLILYFYPRDDTSGCTLEARDFTALRGAFEAIGYAILGVSRDSIASHAKFRAKHALGIDLASDLEGACCQAYGVWVEKVLYGKRSMGIERSTFAIGSDRKLRAIWRKVRTPGHAEMVLRTLGG